MVREFFAAAKRASLPLVVYTTGGPSGARYAPSMSVDYATAGIESVLNSGIPAVVLQPTFYFENLQPDLFVPNLHSQGILDYPPMPDTLKVQWVSHVDQGKIAAAALGRPDLARQAFEIGSKPALTGAELAKLLETWVGRDVRFSPVSPLAFGQRVEDALNAPGMAASMDDLYGTVAKLDGDEMAIDIAELETTFDVQLTPIADQIAAWPKR